MKNSNLYVNDDLSDGKKVCPFVDKPSAECFCVAMNSLKIVLVVEFCMRNYQKCPLFEKLMQAKQDITNL